MYRNVILLCALLNSTATLATVISHEHAGAAHESHAERTAATAVKRGEIQKDPDLSPFSNISSTARLGQMVSPSGKRHMFGSKEPPVTPAMMTHSNLGALSTKSFDETYEGDENQLEDTQLQNQHFPIS